MATFVAVTNIKCDGKFYPAGTEVAQGQFGPERWKEFVKLGAVGVPAVAPASLTEENDRLAAENVALKKKLAALAAAQKSQG